MRRRWQRVLASLIAIGVIAVVISVGVMQSWAGGDAAAAAEADYAVVLGAKVNGTTPSRALRARLDAALRFMELNESAPVIVCGGQGPDEGISEAQAMYDYLAAHGADMTRVCMEDQSTTTRENLINAKAIASSLGLGGGTACIISSEFHLCRAQFIARSLGIDACALGSRTTPYPYKLFYSFREVPALLKALVQAA